MKTIRCSSLPRIMSCPASLDVGDVAINSSSDNASIGTAVHEVMADIIRAGDFQMPELYPYAARNGVEVDDISFLCWRGLSWWKKYAPSLSEIDVETEESIIVESDANGTYKTELSGHADVTAYDSNGVGIVIDWKTGADRDQLDQLKGYALLHFSGEQNGAKVIVINLRENISEVYPPEGGVYTRKQLRSFSDEIVDKIRMKPKNYSPTIDNCEYCQRRLDCPARQGMMQRAASVMEYQGKTGALSTREGLALAYEKSKQLKTALKEYDEALKMALNDGGDITLPDGRVLTLQECERDTITPSSDFFSSFQWAIHKEGEIFTHDDAIKIIGEDAFTVKKQAVIKAVRSYATKGEKDDEEEHFMKDIRAAGCVKTTKFDKIVCRKG